MTVGKSKVSRWYSHGLRFSCAHCGKCCSGGPGYVWINRSEAQRIADFIDMDIDDFMAEKARYVHGRYSLQEKADGDCIFLNRDPVKCAVYEVRPAQCRQFPFWPMILKKKKYWESRAEDCPGMGQGRLYSEHEIEKIMENSNEKT